MLVFSCGFDPDPLPCTDYEWSYSGSGAPEYWIECYVDCSGKQQSPVNITNTVQDSSLVALDFNYDSTQMIIQHTGNLLFFPYAEGSQIRTTNSGNFPLIGVQFRTRSEHAIDGDFYPMEMQIVHQRPGGRYLVVGVLIERGQANPLLEKVIDMLPENSGEEFNGDFNYTVESLLPAEKGYYLYEGSLTNPPCTENTLWYIMKTPITASDAQIEKFRAIQGDNFRPLQSLESREIREY